MCVFFLPEGLNRLKQTAIIFVMNRCWTEKPTAVIFPPARKTVVTYPTLITLISHVKKENWKLFAEQH